MACVAPLVRSPLHVRGFSNRPVVRSQRPDLMRCASQKGPSVNFTDTKPAMSDIFDLDKNINSALQWENVHNFLNQRGGVMSVTRKAAEKLVADTGYTCIDVRTDKGFKEGPTLPGAVNVPVFKSLDGETDVKTRARQVFFSLLPNVEGTVYNESFVEDVVAAVGSMEAPILLSCAKGGLIHKSKYYPRGIASRSYIAAAILIKAGFTNVAHLHGGTGEKSKATSLDRNVLLEFLYGKELPAGTTSPMLMSIGFTVAFGYLACLIIPKLPQATLDLAMRAGWI